MNEEETEELMLMAFKKGQEKTDCPDYPMKIWVKDEIQQWKKNSIEKKQ